MARNIVGKIPGHALTVHFSGERRRHERSSTGTCACGGWEESASTQAEVRVEYRHHLRKVAQQRDIKAALDEVAAAAAHVTAAIATMRSLNLAILTASQSVRRRQAALFPTDAPACGDNPAPCNCDDPTTHGGHR